MEKKWLGKLKVYFGSICHRVIYPFFKKSIEPVITPGFSRKKEKLTTHIITTAHVLLSKYPNCGMHLDGDRNSLNLAPILQGLPRCRQIVTKNTHDDKCLDVLITNQVPIICPGLQPDNPARAKPSDHLVPVAYPISGGSVAITRQYQVKTTRPLPDSGGEFLKER